MGYQLRPYLFGLLAVLGASYPLSGVHVALASSSVIKVFFESYLLASLVWFFHNRKIIIHMTDNVKELCGMTTVNNPPSVLLMTLCLYWSAAEAVELWVVALQTVVHLVKSSCHYQDLEILLDFDAAGRNHVLCYAISNAMASHMSNLVCCKTDTLSSGIGGDVAGGRLWRQQHPEHGCWS